MPWAAIIPAVASIGGSLIASKASSSAQKKAQQAAQNDPSAMAQRQAIEQQQAYGKQAGDAAGRLEPQYEDNVKFLLDRYRNLLGDDNSAAMGVISPLIRARKEATQAQLRLTDFLPRGGGTNEALSHIYDTEHSDILDLLHKARTAGETNLLQLTGDVGSRAAGYNASAAGVSGNAASLLGSMADRSLQAGQVAAQGAGQTAYAVGQSLGQIFAAIMNRNKDDEGGGGGGWKTFNPPPVPTGYK